MLAIENRHSRRLPIATDQPPGQLFARGVLQNVVVLDQSAAGFAIEIEKPCDLAPGDIVRLAWCAECSRLRVVHRIESREHIRFGLLRLEELFSSEDLAPPSTGWPQLLPPRPRRQSNFLLYTVSLLMLAGLFVGASWGVSRQSTSWKLREMGFVPVAANDSASHAKIVSPRDAAPQADFAADNSATINQGVVRKRSSALTKAADEFARTIPGLVTESPKQITTVAAQAAQAVADGASTGLETLLLALPQYRGLLNLSAGQQLRVDAILTQSREAMNAIQSQRAELGTKQVMEQIASIRQRAGQAVLAELTPEQLAKLQKLGAGHRPVAQSR